MSYQVLARKWRSQNFQDLVGQEHISQTLINALKSNRFPHALLFSGTRGVGKTSSARILAKTLICPNIKDFNPCNECTACIDITNGSHMDVIEIDGASNNGVDAIRELRETVSYTPANGKYKVYIIDEVHMLSTSAFNALLKTLEEPPAHVVFIMATTEPHKIPVTILSRCQRFDFRKITTPKIFEHIENICTSEQIQFDKDALWTIARLADGSMRDGLSLLDQAINFTNANLTSETVADVLGTTNRSLLKKTLESLVTRNTNSLFDVISTLNNQGIDPNLFIQNLLEDIRNLSFIKASENPSQLIDLSQAEIENLTQLTKDISSEDLHFLFDICLKGAQDVLRSQTPQIVLEMLLLKMSQAPRILEISELLNSESKKKTLNLSETSAAIPQASDIQNITSEQPKRSLMDSVFKNKSAENTKSSAAEKFNTEISAETTFSHKDLNFKETQQQPKPLESEVFLSYDESKSHSVNWTNFIQNTKVLGPILKAQLEHCVLVEFKNNKLTLSVHEKDRFFYEQLKEAKQIQKIKDSVLKIWKQEAIVDIQLHKEVAETETLLSPKDIQKITLKKEEDDLHSKINESPVIKRMKSNFEGSIIEIL